MGWLRRRLLSLAACLVRWVLYRSAGGHSGVRHDEDLRALAGLESVGARGAHARMESRRLPSALWQPHVGRCLLSSGRPGSRAYAFAEAILRQPTIRLTTSTMSTVAAQIPAVTAMAGMSWRATRIPMAAQTMTNG